VRPLICSHRVACAVASARYARGSTGVLRLLNVGRAALREQDFYCAADVGGVELGAVGTCAAVDGAEDGVLAVDQVIAGLAVDDVVAVVAPKTVELPPSSCPGFICPANKSAAALTAHPPLDSHE
jgi:hypothetical protein